MAATQYPVFTIGHSNHSPAAFRALLQRGGVAAVADVRSAPYSRYAPQFNRDALKEDLAKAGLAYLFLGGELGGRPPDRSCYDPSGRVCYDRVAAADFFADGLRRIIRQADDCRLALMCTEKEPLECHRALLVARALTERGVAVKHIHANGDLECHAAAMNRLLALCQLPPEGDLFRSRDEVIAAALTRQAQRVAYVRARPEGGRTEWAAG